MATRSASVLNASPKPPIAEAANSPRTTGATVTVMPDTAYELQVRAVSAEGVGAYSASLDIDVEPLSAPPSALRNLVATPGEQQVTLSWSAPENDGGADIDRYEVQVDTGQWRDAGTDLQEVVSGLTNGRPTSLGSGR